MSILHRKHWKSSKLFGKVSWFIRKQKEVLGPFILAPRFSMRSHHKNKTQVTITRRTLFSAKKTVHRSTQMFSDAMYSIQLWTVLGFRGKTGLLDSTPFGTLQKQSSMRRRKI